MEKADEISWLGDAEERLIERAASLEAHKTGLGQRLLQEVSSKITDISQNLNVHQERAQGERVAVLEKSNFILVYKKVPFKDNKGNVKLCLVVTSVRRSY
jgi:hypothetical protein